MKKIVKIDFLNFGERFKKENNEFYHILKEKYEVVISGEPDYVICNPIGIDHLKYDCIRIFWTAEQIVTDFNVFDYGLAYEYMDFGDRYCRHCAVLNNSNLLKPIEKRVVDGRKLLGEKTSFCNFVYGNGKGEHRKEFFDLLSMYKKVDSCGTYLNNVGYRIGSTESDKISWQKAYKFSIAFENFSSPGYTTEKILHAFAANTVPIYYGNPRVAEEFNTKAFINCNDYSSFDEVVDRVKELDHDDEKYIAMLEEPPLIGTTYEERREKVETFIYHIFDQELDKCSRRNKLQIYNPGGVGIPNTFIDKALPVLFKSGAVGKRQMLDIMFKSMASVAKRWGEK